jgi:BON domain
LLPGLRRGQRLHLRLTAKAMLSLLIAALFGGALVYFLDPDKGARRRNVARDRVLATLRRTGTRAERAGRKVGADVYGWRQKATHAFDQAEIPANDETLARKVETELFRDPAIPKGKLNINVEHGVVVLRGEADNPEQVRALEEQAQRVAGVTGVKNLLHLPGTPAPQP